LSQELLGEKIAGKNGTTGIKIQGAISRENDQIALKLNISNHSSKNITNASFKLKKNRFQLGIENSKPNFALGPLQSTECKFALIQKQEFFEEMPISVPLVFKCFMTCTEDIFTFRTPCMYHLLLVLSVWRFS